jgi:hypothetical protein
VTQAVLIGQHINNLQILTSIEVAMLQLLLTMRWCNWTLHLTVWSYCVQTRNRMMKIHDPDDDNVRLRQFNLDQHADAVQDSKAQRGRAGWKMSQWSLHTMMMTAVSVSKAIRMLSFCIGTQSSEYAMPGKPELNCGQKQHIAPYAPCSHLY